MGQRNKELTSKKYRKKFISQADTFDPEISVVRFLLCKPFSFEEKINKFIKLGQ